MNALLLTTLLTLGQAGDAKPPAEEQRLLQKIDAAERELATLRKELARLRGARAPDVATALEKDFRDMLKDDGRAKDTVKAAALFRAAKADEALLLLRRTRSPAAVPLILKDLLTRTGDRAKPEETAPHLLALTLLTGVDCAGEAPPVERLVHDWWLPGKAKITTDPDRMTIEQRDVIARTLLQTAASQPNDSYGMRPRADNAYDVHHNLYQLFYSSGYRDSRRWSPDEIHPALAPHLLAALGLGAKGEDTRPVRYEAVPLLAELRRNGAAPQLDKVAKDAAQPMTLRLVCALALHGADEELPVPVLLDVYARSKRLEVKLPALSGLAFAKDLKPAADVLAELLDGPGAQVPRAALDALANHPPPAVLPRLRLLLAKEHSRQAVYVVAKIRTPEATAFLADYLDRCIKEGGPKTDKIHDTIWAFQEATGQSVIVAGSYQFDYLRDRANVALEKWRKQSK